MKLLKIDHLGIVVPSLDEAVKAYQALGFAVESTHDVPTEKVRAAFLPLGESRLELLEPTDPSSVIARFLEKLEQTKGDIDLELYSAPGSAPAASTGATSRWATPSTASRTRTCFCAAWCAGSAIRSAACRSVRACASVAGPDTRCVG